MMAADRFVFLNEAGDLAGSGSWNDLTKVTPVSTDPVIPDSTRNPAKSKLWLYNLHYFDDLNADGAPERVDWHRKLIRRWIDENPPAAGIGWEPYPLSLRIANWIKWSLRGNALEPAWRDSLATQVAFLRKRLEYHLLGNHLLANARALVFAGLFFTGDEADEWLAKGLALLAREVPEQVLADGGHFERSPMYHAIVLQDLLDLVNVFGVYGMRHPGAANSGTRDLPQIPASAGMTKSAGMTISAGMTSIRMLTWLNTMTHPDGGIGFFNDAALGIAPSCSALADYAGRLGLTAAKEPATGLQHLAASGYIRLQRASLAALLDVGEIGPDYLPGHAHADTLAFELSLYGHRVLVNSGTSTYASGAERQRQRGTAAHNTVEINGQNSSEVWAGFRVARRARPFGLRVEESDGAIAVSCSHDGYRRLKGRPVHTRHWRFEPGRILVRDTIEGGFKRAVVFYHLHPDARASCDDMASGTIELDGRAVNWSVTGGRASVEDSTWHPGFGLSIPNQVIKLVFAGAEVVFVMQWGQG